jgi:pyruvate-ferredoxin/flavodoxin oxidoreductase
MTGATDVGSMITLDANEAVADVAYRLSEVIAIYPITPASAMGEHADSWAAKKRPNLWGAIPQVTEMQSEGGAAGAVHGALQAGSLTTTFTASQGLLLMLPNMYKIAGELTPCVFHIAARTIATHALSIFADHSDVYAARQTGFAMLVASSVQEAHDFALIAQAASLHTRLPFLHIFDGFRTSHEIAKIVRLHDDDLAALIDDELVATHRRRALSPEHPVVRGTAQNPDVFFQAREAAEPYYQAAPAMVQEIMDRFAERSGRRYHLVEYVGHPEAERVIVLMGSAAETAQETVEFLASRGQRVGALKVHLYRPFPVQELAAALPRSVRALAVMDRAKEPGATGEPLYLDVLGALHELEDGPRPRVVGGRYGLSSKEFTPAMVKGILDELAGERPRNHFTVGIVDDVSRGSLDYDESFTTEPDDVIRCVFYGLGSDGTVGANKNSIKIIGEHTDHFVQGFFVYDSKKAGAQTVSHLRFGPRPLRSTYLIRSANFVACHQWRFLDQYDVLERAAPGAVFLLNAPHGPDEVWGRLSRDVQQAIIDKNIQLHVIDGYRVAREAGMGRRINTVMQTCFFAISGVLPRDQAIAAIKAAIEESYGKHGRAVVEMNWSAVDSALAHLYQVRVPAEPTSTALRPPAVPGQAPDFVQRVTALMIAGKGDLLPVSAFAPDGTWPTATARWEKRNLAHRIPVWDKEICIQCNKCALVCPHAAVRAKVYPETALAGAPGAFQSTRFRGKELADHAYTIQIAPEDCTGCSLCVAVCPAKDKANPRHKALDLADQAPLRRAEIENYAFFLDLPELDPDQRAHIPLNVKNSQFLEPLFEYSGACAGCGETPYIKLMTQLFGDRMVIANSTGCSSIYGGNLPTTPYTVNREGRGPAWSNSLFEDNAEFGLGIRLAIDHQAAQARALISQLENQLGELAGALIHADCADEAGIAAQRVRVRALRARLATMDDARARRLELFADTLVPRSVWIVGGDGWAYDIGYGGLDHVLASGKDVNILVLDTEVYSNTGGQTSKATPLAAAAKFSAQGKDTPKKDLGLLAMTYGNVYVAQVAFGAKDQQTLRAFVEAASYPGPSLIIAYSHCIAHGYDLGQALTQHQLAVKTGYWPLYRFDPRLRQNGGFPLRLDSPAPTAKLSEFAYNETRFRLLLQSDPERARELMDAAQAGVNRRFAMYQQLARNEQE